MTSKPGSIVGAYIINNPKESSEKSSDGEAEECSPENLQSINKKLIAENAQLQAKIRELEAQYNRMKNLPPSCLEEQIVAERKRLYDILEMLPVYVILLDKDHGALFTNKFFRERFGEISGKRCYELFNRDTLCENCETYKVLKTNSPNRWDWTAPDGRNYEIHDLPFVEADGSTIILEIGIDVTDRKRAENELIKNHDHLEELVMNRTRELESFSYSVSHDLRIPIRAMSGFSAILLEDYADKLDKDGLGFLQRIVNGAEKANNLIDDMLNLSKITCQELILQDVDLRPQVASVIDELRRSEPRRKVKVTVGGDLKTHGDKRLLNIVLTNLIGNAWKYTGKVDEACVEIGVLNKGGIGKVFFVKDNGAGFNMAHVGKLFQPFQRLHKENQFPGTGIGLAIVDRIIKRHGGKVWAEAQEGKGATFYFSLGKSGNYELRIKNYGDKT